jgi:hypothetical protein
MPPRPEQHGSAGEAQCHAQHLDLLPRKQHVMVEGDTMLSQRISKFFLAALITVAALPLAAQSNPSAAEGAWPIIAGGGLSRFNLTYPNVKSSTMEGPTFWADWVDIPFLPKQIGLQAEYRKINMGAPSDAPQLRTDAFLGGPTYTMTFSRLAVYGKGLAGYGTLNFPPFGTYSHDSRTIYGFGGGLEYRTWNSIWLRGDYEYQYWPDLFLVGGMHPNGVTFSVGYDFRTLHRAF